MHSALLLDEILRHILDFFVPDSHGSLLSISTTCKAWKEPALDYIWVRLPSAVPLLQLIPELTLDDGVYILRRPVLPEEMNTFLSYAKRVKNVVYQQGIDVHKDVLTLIQQADGVKTGQRLGMLHNLRTARFNAFGMGSPLHATLGLSSRLQQLDLDLGFKALSLPSDRASEYLEGVSVLAPHLQRIKIRGTATPRLNEIISSMSNLESACLQIGSSLMLQTFVAIAEFPSLSSLEIHVDHFDHESLNDMFNQLQRPTFSSLAELRLRASTSIMQVILRHIPCGTLRTVRLEADDEASTSSSWVSIFNLLCEKSRNTLQMLTIEHHVAFSDIELESNISDTTTTLPIPSSSANDYPENTLDIQLSFKTLQSLRHLRSLRHLVFDMTLPPALIDQDIETLVLWWPEMQHLDLGVIPSIEDLGQGIKSQLSISSLLTFARSLKNLKSLVLPIDISAVPDPLGSPNHSGLKKLTIGHSSVHDPIAMARYLHSLFPSLDIVGGSCDDDKLWDDIQHALQKYNTNITS